MPSKPNPLQIGDRQKCLACPKFFPVEELKQGYCWKCHARELRLSKKEIKRIEDKAKARASSKLATALAKAKDTSAISPEILESFYKEIGGPSDYGQMLAADFQKSRGVGLSEVEKEDFQYNAATMARWHEIVLKFQQREDERNSTDLSTISPEDLDATVKQVALEMLLNDEEICESVLQVAAKKNPALAKEMAENAGLVALPKEDEETIEYEED